MATVRNSVVKGKKKKSTNKARSKAGDAARKAKLVDKRVTGFDLKKFSSDVRAKRKAAKISQRTLGAKTGMTSAAVVFMEKARSAPLTQNFARICQFFKLDPNRYI